MQFIRKTINPETGAIAVIARTNEGREHRTALEAGDAIPDHVPDADRAEIAAAWTADLVTAAGQRRAAFLPPVPSGQDLADALCREAKIEAGRRIVALAPEWKQRNATARGVELTDKKASGEPLTADEQAEVDAMKALWLAISAIRAASDDLETAIAGMDDAGLQALDVTADEHWL